MRKVLLLMTCAAAVLLTACNQPTAVNTTNTANTANTANTNTAATAATAEADIRKLLDTAATALAKNDADTMDKIYADNYMLVNIDGSVQNKAERLAALRAGDPKYTAFSYDDVNIRTNPEGNGAIVIARLDMKGTNHGKPLDGYYRVTQVYSKTKDGWKQVSAQATPITGSTTGPASGSPATGGPIGGLPTPDPDATVNKNTNTNK